MSISTTADLPVRAGACRARRSVIASVRAYFASDAARAIQGALRVIWLLDGALQFQAFMYGNGFVEMLKAGAVREPRWIASTVTWSANVFQAHQLPLNTAFALVQIAIGLGILHRRTVKPALALSLVWAVVVWWSGEAFGQLFTGTANALTGAPGAVLVYALVAILVWPSERPGGLLGVRGARLMWALLWMAMGALWLLAANSSANATATLIGAAPSGTTWLTTVQHWAASAAGGDGLPIALVLAGTSIAIGVGAARNWHARAFLLAAIALNLAYWAIGQGLGGIFQGGATDPNAGPLFILLAGALYALVPVTANARRG
ncbi:MAG: hypothetical protein ACLP4R_21770 [Solirubrobacteraceae bacterium]